MSRTRLGGLFFPLLCLTTACSIAPDPRRDRFVPPVALDPAEPAAVSAATSPSAFLVGIGSSYTAGKVGGFFPDGDIEALDDGFAGELVFGRSFLSFLAVEGSIGYLTADGQFGGTQLDLWAIPAFANVRASMPILFFEPYAGAGIGGLYADYEAGSFGESDFVPAWDAFLGVGFGVGNLAVGAELKYLQSGDTKDNFSIEGLCAFVFLSLPF